MMWCTVRVRVRGGGASNQKRRRFGPLFRDASRVLRFLVIGRSVDSCRLNLSVVCREVRHGEDRCLVSDLGSLDALKLRIYFASDICREVRKMGASIYRPHAIQM